MEQGHKKKRGKIGEHEDSFIWALANVALSASILVKSVDLRRYLHGLGSFLALGGLVFVGFRLHGYSSDLDFERITIATVCCIAVLACIYGFANILHALAWRHILLHLGAPVPHLWSVKVYGISQLAKYLPGNVFQFAGRQSLGMADGIDSGKLLKSTVWEISLLVCAGSSFAVLGMPFFWHALSPQTGLFLWAGTVVLACFGLRKFIGPPVSAAFFLQTLFLVVSAGTFVLLLFAIEGTNAFVLEFWPSLGGGYILAWLVGLLTPGAPAGVGVREAVLLFMLRGCLPESDLLLAIILARVVTVFGDLLFFFAAFFLIRNQTLLAKKCGM